MPTTLKTTSPRVLPVPQQTGASATRRAPSRLLALIVIGLVLVIAAWGVRSSRWMRDPILAGKGIPELEASVRDRPGDPLAQYHLAKKYYLQGRFGEARSAYEAATRLDPRSPRAHLGLALTLYEMGRMRDARAQFERVLLLDDRSAWAHYMLGKILWLEGDIRDALPHVRRATELDPRSDQAWYGLSVCYAQLRRYDDAIAALRKAVGRRGDSAQYRAALGEMLVYRGNMEEGRVQLARAVELNPDYGPACALLGSFYLRHGTGHDALDRAQDLLERATRLNTIRPAQAWFDLGQVYVRKARYADAVNALQRSLREDARDERTYYALANAYRRMGQAAKALTTEARFRRISALHVRMQDLEAKLSHAPNDPDAHLNLARVYRDLGLIGQAAERYASAARLAPQSGAISREWQQFARVHAPEPGGAPPVRDFIMPAPP
uniref:Uncharacterized protein n=1 Tax=uncultured Armatimonadetes bacterium TaxID=157466 RepID=A0A6J4H343_9BACT|nr:hypothetical protein AVDCRST_MAG63-70 [uncultured Armatimonadetes bacterium]